MGAILVQIKGGLATVFPVTSEGQILVGVHGYLGFSRGGILVLASPLGLYFQLLRDKLTQENT